MWHLIGGGSWDVLRALARDQIDRPSPPANPHIHRSACPPDPPTTRMFAPLRRTHPAHNGSARWSARAGREHRDDRLRLATPKRPGAGRGGRARAAKRRAACRGSAGETEGWPAQRAASGEPAETPAGGAADRPDTLCLESTVSRAPRASATTVLREARGLSSLHRGGSCHPSVLKIACRAEDLALRCVPMQPAPPSPYFPPPHSPLERPTPRTMTAKLRVAAVPWPRRDALSQCVCMCVCVLERPTGRSGTGCDTTMAPKMPAWRQHPRRR